MSEKDTKSTILDAAEELFAQRGFEATSLREITRAADVNTAAVHYHFGSRTGLIEAVIARRAGPINAERLRRLDAIEAAHEDALPLEPVLRALIEPVVRIHVDSSLPGDVLGRLMGRVVVEAGEELHEAIVRTFSPIAERFLPALQRALPHLSIPEIGWRVHLIIGSVLFTLAVPHGRTCPCESLDNMSPGALTDRLVSFAVATMQCPTDPSPGEDAR